MKPVVVFFSFPFFVVVLVIGVTSPRELGHLGRGERQKIRVSMSARPFQVF